jgi:hypothetical protein
MTRLSRHVIGAFVLAGCAAALAPVHAQTKPAAPAVKKAWVLPRTPDGKPDLQGNWTNETQTPLERQTPGGLTLTDAQAKAIEDRAQFVRHRPREATGTISPPLANNRSSSRFRKPRAARSEATTASGSIQD